MVKWKPPKRLGHASRTHGRHALTARARTPTFECKVVLRRNPADPSNTQIMLDLSLPF